MWVTHALFCVTHARCRFEFDMLRPAEGGKPFLRETLPNEVLERKCGSSGAAADAGAAGVGHSKEKRYPTRFPLKDYVLLIDC